MRKTPCPVCAVPYDRADGPCPHCAAAALEHEEREPGPERRLAHQPEQSMFPDEPLVFKLITGQEIVGRVKSMSKYILHVAEPGGHDVWLAKSVILFHTRRDKDL